jgi:LPXTG-site transpeptidase (sortase) family protein
VTALHLRKAWQAALIGVLALAALAPAPLAVSELRSGGLVHHLTSGSASSTPAGDAPAVEPADAPQPIVPQPADYAVAIDRAELAAGLRAAAPPADLNPAGETSQSTGAALIPTQVVIPALEIDAPVVAVGLTPWGAMATPARVEEVGWFEPGAAPGVEGTAILAGHRDSPAGPAVFFHLERLAAGDEIHVHRRAGAARLTFRVQRVEVYPYDAAPLETIFGTAAPPGLILITCVGDFSYAEGYTDRVVVYAELATP